MPTASLAAIMIPCMSDAFDKRDVAPVGIPGESLKTKISKGEDDMYTVLDGQMTGSIFISPGAT